MIYDPGTRDRGRPYEAYNMQIGGARILPRRVRRPIDPMNKHYIMRSRDVGNFIVSRRAERPSVGTYTCHAAAETRASPPRESRPAPRSETVDVRCTVSITGDIYNNWC